MRTALVWAFALAAAIPNVHAQSDDAARTYSLMREDEDWSFLKDPSLRQDFWDPIKYIRLGPDGWFLTIGGEAREAFDLANESRFTRQEYGDGEFASACLIARRLVERGVRVVQVYYGDGQPWDDHQDINKHREHARKSDRPIASLCRGRRVTQTRRPSRAKARAMEAPSPSPAPITRQTPRFPSASVMGASPDNSGCRHKADTRIEPVATGV